MFTAELQYLCNHQSSKYILHRSYWMLSYHLLFTFRSFSYHEAISSWARCIYQCKATSNWDVRVLYRRLQYCLSKDSLIPRPPYWGLGTRLAKLLIQGLVRVKEQWVNKDCHLLYHDRHDTLRLTKEIHKVLLLINPGSSSSRWFCSSAKVYCVWVLC